MICYIFTFHLTVSGVRNRFAENLYAWRTSWTFKTLCRLLVSPIFCIHERCPWQRKKIFVPCPVQTV